MPIEFRCSDCQKLLRTPDDSAGRQAQCPHCQAIQEVPFRAMLSSGLGEPLRRPVLEARDEPQLRNDDPYSDNPFASSQSTNPIDAAQPSFSGERTGPPWEERTSVGSYFSTVKMVLLQPSDTFSNMRRTGGLVKPFAFSVAVSLLVIPLMVLFVAFMDEMAPAERVSLLAMIPLWFVGVAMMLLLSTLMINFLLFIFGGSEHGFQATFRVNCYTMGAVMLLQLIPVVSMFASIWMIVVQTIGIARVHEVSGAKAFGVVFLAWLIPLAAVIGIAVLAPR
ncbi:MAG: YIP1 family protein [Planctomycetota bacterium]|nr:YIP1 family protein [Planctomycetota bacterium]